MKHRRQRFGDRRTSMENRKSLASMVKKEVFGVMVKGVFGRFGSEAWIPMMKRYFGVCYH